MTHACGAPIGSGPCLTQPPSSPQWPWSRLWHRTGDTGNLLNRKMRPPEPQQAGIAFGAWQGLEQHRIYAQQLARNGKECLIGNPTA